MKPVKKLGKRLLASVLSAALLTSTTAVTLTQTTTAAAADNDYYQALALSLYMYDANACGTGITGGPLTWRGDCHTYDGTADLSAAVNFDQSTKSIVDPDGDGKVDVSGGYHDAGDHIKFNLTMGFAMSSLAMSEYLNPGVYAKAGCKDHLFAIVKRNADYMMKTTFLDSSGEVATICHVVADGNVDHNYWSAPETQNYARATYWLTKGSNNSAVCGEMASALGGAAYLLKDTDPSYAKECIKYAKALIKFGTQHVGNEARGLATFYDTEAQYQDEIGVAEAWMYILGEGSQPSLKPQGGGSYGGAGYDGYMYCWNKVFQGYSAMMYKATGDTAFASELEYDLNNQGGLKVGTYNGDGWGAARYNCAKQMVAYTLAKGDANSSYATGAKWQMDYILGGNPLGYSFLIGYGNKWPTHYHHRAANPGNGDPMQNPEAKYVLYGALVGGIDASGKYEDITNGYQYTEPAIDYNGCFALACAGLANLYGGSDTGAKNIVSSASEVKYPYNFGYESSTPGPSTQPTEGPSTQPTEGPSTQQPTNPPTPSTPSEKDADYEKVEGDGSSVQWEFKVFGAKKLVVTLKTNSSDTEATGGWGYWDNSIQEWHQVDADNWKASPDGSGKFTVEYDIPSGLGTLQLQVWWPNSATVESAKLLYDTQGQQQPATEAPTQPPVTNPPATEPPTNAPEQPKKYGDMDGDGQVDLVDVIKLNKYLMIGAPLSSEALANADVDKNGVVDEVDSLNILKYIIRLVELPVK